MLRALVTITFFCMALPAAAATPDPDEILASGKFAEGIVALEAHLKQQPKDDKARFGLGLIQFVQSAQSLIQRYSIYGVQTRGNAQLQEILAVQSAPKEPLTYPLVRQITQEWLDDLSRIDETLSRIESEEVKLALHVGRIPLSLTRNGGPTVTLLPLLRDFRLGPPSREADFEIVFDRADVDWLRGYCHILRAIGEMILSHDSQGLFDVIAHRIFKHVKTPHEFLLEPRRSSNQGWWDWEEIADIIAAIHMIRFPVIEPKRMIVALDHLEHTLSFSREMWKRVLAETDDDHEWIPNPKQNGAINVNVSQEMIDNWLQAVDEAESVLKGKKLVPFWRGNPTRGVNVRRVFLEPTQLDLVLWIQGTAATPYLEVGESSSPDTWERINRAFGGRFFGFGFWFN